MPGNPPLVLASSSPRRLALLRQIGVEPDKILDPGIDEAPLPRELPRPLVSRLAAAKLDAVTSVCPVEPCYILSADTVVACGRRVLPKTSDAESARACLRLLSGRRHRVHTAVAVRAADGRRVLRVAVTMVRFKRLADDELQAYLASGEWQGKAGGYAIQGRAEGFALAINGSYSNVVGLPLAVTVDLLRGLGWRFEFMNRELLIEATPFGSRSALLADGRLIEVAFADAGHGGLRGTIYHGRVRAIERDLDAAFVDCGSGIDGWLGARDARLLGGRASKGPIDRQLREGQAVIVQVRREAQGGKGPRLTGDVALTGPCLTYWPRRPAGEQSARPSSGGADPAELSAEAAGLRRLWQAIADKAAGVGPPALLHGPADPVAWLLADQLGADPERVVAGDPATLARARRYLQTWRPALLARLSHQPDAFAASGAAEQLAAALEPVVPLAGGGSLTIEPTAALTAIDVDGGGRQPLETDLEAAGEVARQLRLRQLGGTIVVDFIDLATKAERERVVRALRKALADDPLPVEVFPMSALGLVQISRQRYGPDLAARFSRNCPACEGRGLLANVRRRCEDLMQEIASRSPTRLRARIAPDLHAHLTGAAAPAWQAFGAHQGMAPPLEIDASLAPGGYLLEEAR